MATLLEDGIKQIEIERYTYETPSGITVLFQRMMKDCMWYGVSLNQIVCWGKYRNDLEEWCDMAL